MLLFRFKKVARYEFKDFLNEIWTEDEIQRLLVKIWGFIDEKLFEKTRTGLEERFISNRTRNLVEALFGLALELGENVSYNHSCHANFYEFLRIS